MKKCLFALCCLSLFFVFSSFVEPAADSRPNDVSVSVRAQAGPSSWNYNYYYRTILMFFISDDQTDPFTRPGYIPFYEAEMALGSECPVDSSWQVTGTELTPPRDPHGSQQYSNCWMLKVHIRFFTTDEYIVNYMCEAYCMALRRFTWCCVDVGF